MSWHEHFTKGETNIAQGRYVGKLNLDPQPSTSFAWSTMWDVNSVCEVGITTNQSTTGSVTFRPAAYRIVMCHHAA